MHTLLACMCLGSIVPVPLIRIYIHLSLTSSCVLLFVSETSSTAAPSQGAISGSGPPATLQGVSRDSTSASSLPPLAPVSPVACRVGNGLFISASMQPKPIPPCTVFTTSGASYNAQSMGILYGSR